MTRLASLALCLVSCATLKQVAQPEAARPLPPKVVVAEVTLAAHPAAPLVARALCPQLAPMPVCMALGGKPPAADLRITFALQLDVTNPNAFPLPLVEALVAFTAWPGAQGAQNLGAVCMSFCDDPNQCPPRADACTAGGPEIRTVNDFAAASAGLLVGLATGQERAENLKVRTLPANGTARVTISLALDPEQMVALLGRLAGEALQAVKRGSVPTFSIPYQIEGSAWVTVEGLGRIAAGFGPFQGKWDIQ